MTILTQYLQQKQEQRTLEASSAVEIKLDRQAYFSRDKEFSAHIGAEPDPVLTANESYRRGYNDSFWQFYFKKYGIQIKTKS